MPRRQVQFAPGQYYHIYNRGVGRQSIFWEDKNYLYLLQLLKQVTAKCCVTVIAYCLLPNHYHWLLRQNGDTPAGQVPRRVFGSYSQAFNRAYDRSGTLFEGPYDAIQVETEEYLRHLCPYIHANPVRHTIAADVELWPYSNYLEWIGKRSGTLVDRAFIEAHFTSIEAYQAYLQSLITGELMYLSSKTNSSCRQGCRTTWMIWRTIEVTHRQCPIRIRQSPGHVRSGCGPTNRPARS